MDALTGHKSLCIKFLKQLAFWLTVGMVLFLATKTLAESTYSPNPLTTDVFYKPNPPSDTPVATSRLPLVRGAETHSIRASKTISEGTLRLYLESHHSPLAALSGELLASNYWSTIIGICTIEEYSCSVNPYGTNNLWGLMSGGKLIAFDSLSSGISAINTFLARAESNGRITIESFRGWYCVGACTNWESTVIKTKLMLESL